MNKINLIIPSAGIGQRFIDAGFDIFKPLIQVLGKPMIKHVIDAFPEDINVYIITDNNHKEVLSENLHCKQKINYIIIDAHKSGPAWSLYMAQDKLPEDDACFVTYNDVMWQWDFEKILQYINFHKPDGVVFTQTGFHPHLFNNSYSAFCKIKGNKLLAIKEKGYFTDNWMHEPLSTGVYYFSDTSSLIKNIETLVRKDIKTSGEFFPSEVFNLMITENKKVLTYETEFFAHTGIPEQYCDVLRWEKIMTKVNKKNNVPVLIMMCGKGLRMKKVAYINKAGLLIDKMAMFEYVATKMRSDNNCFLVNDDTFSLLKAGMNSINIHKQTHTQTESMKNALPLLPRTKDLLINSNDCYGLFDTEALKNVQGFDMVLFGFEPSLLQRKQQNAHSGFSFSGNSVQSIAIKSLPKNYTGLAGMYYFPDSVLLKELCNFDCTKNENMEQFAQYLLEKNYNVGCIKLDYYIHLGTPEEYSEYMYWNKFFSKPND